LPRSLALAVSNGSLRSLRCSPGSRRLRRIRRNACVGELAQFSTRFVGSSCRSAARTSRARIALGSRRHRCRSGTKSCPLAPPQHGGARSGIGLPRSLALASRCKPRRLSAQGHEFSSDRAHSLLICGLVRRNGFCTVRLKHHSFFKAWKKGWSSFVHLN